MIFETIISTINNKGQVNFAPFGVKKDKQFIFISPYIPSKTLHNLEETMQATINYVNDSSFFINCILGEKKFDKKKCFIVKGFYLKEALSHDEVVVDSVVKDKKRPTFKCRVVKKIYHKRFEGFNRAHAALIEACILASRVKILKKKRIINELNNLTNSIIKTAGRNEQKDWKLIRNYILNETQD